MFCTKCATNLPDDANYCSKCGIHIQGDCQEKIVKWEFELYYHKIYDQKLLGISESHSSNLWDEQKYAAGNTPFDVIIGYGLKGWELVSVTPIATFGGEHAGGQTTEILFAFKRPIE